jgi:sulfonate transport system permease protein
VLPVLVLAVWEACARAGLVSPFLLPAPNQVLATLVHLGSDGTLALHVAASAARVLGGFSLGACFGAALGFLVGVSPRAEEWLDPSLQAVRSVPSLAWVPLLILWMGIDELPKVTLIAIGAFFPVYLGVASGVRGIDRRLIELGRVYGLNRRKMIVWIILPGSVSSLMTGLRTGLAVAWLYVVAAELVAAHSGLGFLLTDGRELSRSDLIFSAILLLALCGKVTDGLLKAIEKRLLAWRAPAPSFVGGSPKGIQTRSPVPARSEW